MSCQDAIGVFDSGLGGLSAVKEFLHVLPNEKIIYFIEGVSGTLAIKRAKQVKQKKKKDDDGTADPKFLAKRFVTYFPELREEIKNEEDCYFPFRGATFAKEHIAPKIPMYIKRANKNEIEKFANVFNVQYNNGDVDTRAIITIVLLNSLDDAEYNALS